MRLGLVWLGHWFDWRTALAIVTVVPEYSQHTRRASIQVSHEAASYMYKKSDREGYKPLRRRFRRGGLRSAWGAVDCVGSDHSMSS